MAGLRTRREVKFPRFFIAAVVRRKAAGVSPADDGRLGFLLPLVGCAGGPP